MRGGTLEPALEQSNQELALAGQPAPLASRTEHVTRRHAADILITAAMREALGVTWIRRSYHDCLLALVGP